MTKSITRDDILRVINDQGTSLESVDRALSTQTWVPFNPLYSGWMNWASGPNDAVAACYVDRMNRVTLRGLIQKTGGAPSPGELVAVLPAEAYPPYTVRMLVVGGSVGWADITILSDGTVRWVSGSTDWIALDSISYFAGSKGVSA